MTWPTVRLDEISEINPRLGDALAERDVISFLGMADISELGFTNSGTSRPYSDVKKGYTSFADGDLLFAKITPCFENGKIAQAQLDHQVGFGSTEFHVIRADNARANPRYLLHFIRGPEARLAGKRRMTGSGGQQRVPASFLHSMEVPLPPLCEQRRIATILDQADQLVTKHRRALGLLDELRDSIFDDMFGAEARRAAGAPSMTLGAHILDYQNGIYKIRSDYGSGTEILRIGDFRNGERSRLDVQRRVLVSKSEVEKFTLAPGDIVVNRVNAMTHVGKAALIVTRSEPLIYESNMMRVRVDTRTLLPEYVIQWLTTAPALNQIRDAAKQAINQASINQTDVANLSLWVAPIQRQQTFVDRIAPVAEARRALMARAVALDELFASLQNRAFRGEL